MTNGQPEMLIVPDDVVARPRAGKGAPGQHFMMELRNDHADYSRVLSLLSGEIERLPRMPRRVLPRIGRAFEFITTYIDASHQSREDVLFKQLARRSGQHSKALAQLRQDHRHGLLTSRSINAEIAALIRAPHRARLSALAQDIHAFVEEAREHIRREERILYSESVRRLAAADWLAIERATPAADPDAGFGHRSDSPRYRLLARHLRGTRRRYIRGTTDGVLQQLGVAKAGALYGDVVGHGLGIFILAQSQACEAIGLAVGSARTLLTPRPPFAYAVAVRDTCRAGVDTMARWTSHWHQHFGLAPTELRPARPRTRRKRL